VEKISSNDGAVRRLIARLGSPRRLRACYEAGPTRHELVPSVADTRSGLRGDRGGAMANGPRNRSVDPDQANGANAMVETPFSCGDADVDDAGRPTGTR
jgi:hypothetical protein